MVHDRSGGDALLSVPISIDGDKNLSPFPGETGHAPPLA
jgi:hypothetical protein